MDNAEILGRVSRIFGAGADPRAVVKVLRRSARLRPLVDAAPSTRLLGAWSPFELRVRTIVGQQVTVAAARTLTRRVWQRARTFSPKALAEADLAGIGMLGRRADALPQFARP